MTARCSVHADVAAVGSCVRCGRFVCVACRAAVREGWCVTCASRPEVRLEISASARVTLWLALGGLLFPVFSVMAWRRAATAGTPTEADAPVFQGARWLAMTTLLTWAVALSAWLLQV